MRGLVLATSLLAAACAPLTAHAPLFSVDDQGAAPPLALGVWVQVTDRCRPVPSAETQPRDCAQSELSRLPDGAWRLIARPAGGVGGEQETSAWRFILAPATERSHKQGKEPIYVAEYVSADDPEILYAVVVPIGDRPATQLALIPMIECEDALHEGVITGVQVDTSPGGSTRACYAGSKVAVREAARRTLVERAGDLLGDNTIRFMHVGPAPAVAPRHPAPVLTVGTEAPAALRRLRN